MPDETIQESTEETSQVDTTAETTEETSETTDKRESILDYVKSAFKKRESETQEDTETSEETSEETTETQGDFTRTEEEVPSEFLEAAKQDGWTEEDIKDFASDKTDDELRELIPSFAEEEEEEDEAEEEITDTAEEPAKAEPKEQDWKAVASSMREEIKKDLLSELGNKFEAVDDFKAEQERRQVVNNFETANKIMDGVSKDFPALGEYESMPKFQAGSRKGQLIPTSKEYKARAEIYQLASDMVSAGRSDTIKEAMDDALAWYRGKYGQKETERKVVRNLKKQQQRLSGARTGKEVKRDYSSTRDEIIDHIRQQQKAAGLD
jgi:type III secretory pathway component EscR